MIDVLNKNIRNALVKLNTNDNVLLEKDASERCIAHKLSLYIAEEFPDYNVDNEYNLNIDNERDRKELWELEKRLFDLNKSLYRRHQRNLEDINYYHLSVYPDIIVHKRRSNRNNLLIIEIKKSTNNDVSAIEYDKYKIKKYTTPENINEFKYQFGALITINIGIGIQIDHKIEYYKDGELIAI